MPVGLLELTLAGGGVAGGYALGSRLRQAVHDAAAKLGIDSANDEQQQTQQRQQQPQQLSIGTNMNISSMTNIC